MPEQKGNVKIRLFTSPRDVRLSQTPLGTKITARDCLIEVAPGEPAFPIRYVRVALPEGTEAVRAKARVLQTVNLTDRFTLVRPMPASRIKQDAEGFEFSEEYALPLNREAYERTYRAKRQKVARLVATEGDGIAPIAVVAVNLIQVGAAGDLELHSEIELTVSYQEIAGFEETEAGARNYRIRTAIGQAINAQSIDRRRFLPRGLPASREPAGIVPGTGASGDVPLRGAPGPTRGVLSDVDYLIITDNREWDADKILPGASVSSGGALMTSVFQRLANHKKQRGYRARIVTVSDIVAGYFGDFVTGARDLQEVLRNFLKDFCPRRGVEWVLLGGDKNIIPVRYAVLSGGPWLCGFGDVSTAITTDDPSFGRVEFRDGYLAMRVMKGKVGASWLFDPGEETRHELTMLRSGVIVPHNPANPVGGSDLRWFHTGEDFSTVASTDTEWIRVEGPDDLINSEAMWYTRANRIPTDLYYSSLSSSTCNRPGLHDWDLLDNGIYGQWKGVGTATENVDGVAFRASVGLGRAPVRTATEAEIFCQKVIDYERSPERPQEMPRYRNVVYVAQHVDKTFKQVKKYAAGAGYYFAPDLAQERTLIFAEVLGTGAIDTIISYQDEDNLRNIPFDLDASSVGYGWHYVTDMTNFDPSYSMVLDHKVPVPTPYVAVYSDQTAVLDPMHFVLDGIGVDAAIADTHELATQVADDFPLIDQRICLYTDGPDLQANGGIGFPAVVRYLSPETLDESLQPGPHLLSLNGHGSSGGCCHMQTVLPGLANGTRLFVVWAVSCDTCDLDSADAFGKRIIRHPGGGAVAYVGFSRNSIGYPGPKCRLAFFDKLRKTRHLALLHDARLDMSNTDWVYRFDILSCTLYGDPEMPVYRDYRDAKLRFVGNLHTFELHEDQCPWVRYISRRCFFDSVEEGLSNGFDGCGFCLREHHTR